MSDNNDDYVLFLQKVSKLNEIKDPCDGKSDIDTFEPTLLAYCTITTSDIILPGTTKLEGIINLNRYETVKNRSDLATFMNSLKTGTNVNTYYGDGGKKNNKSKNNKQKNNKTKHNKKK